MVTSLLLSSEKAALHIEAVKYYFMELVCKGGNPKAPSPHPLPLQTTFRPKRRYGCGGN